jgi:A/G-specific adenine glycosylase
MNFKDKENRFVQLLLKWGEKNRRAFPWRKDRTPYKVLLAEILLQRTPANRVAKFFPKLVERFPSPERIVNADVDQLRKFFHPMGLKKRADWLISLLKEVCDKYDCKIPSKEEELIKLPGIGFYTARAVLCFGFGKDVSIVDVNVSRVLSRIFSGYDINRRPSEDKELWSFSARIVPKGLGVQYNESLLDFATIICKKNPLCHKCLLRTLCDYYQKTVSKTLKL